MSSQVGRYRSRLFNFVSQQRRRWADEADRALRHIKVGAIWGTQILLYPVYLIFQAARLTGRQLQQALRQNFDRADEKNIPSVDIPVQKVLETAFSLSSSTKFAGNDDRDRHISSTIKPSLVRGIACAIDTRQMVLVTTENEIAQTLDRHQEREVQKSIGLEISGYLRNLIIAREAQPKQINRLSALDDRPQLLPPLRFFRQAMAWVQKSPVARLVNLFEEEAIILNLEVKAKHLKQKSQQLKIKNDRLNVKSDEWKIKSSPSSVAVLSSHSDRIPSFLVKLDVAIAELETGNLGTISDLTSSLSRSGEKFIQAIESRFPNSGKLTVSRQEGKLTQRDVGDGKYPQSSENIFDIQILIKAAIDYFFGKEKNPRLSSSSPPMAISAAGESAIDDENPWLTQSDVFGEPVIVKPNKRNSVKSPSQRNRLSGQSPDRAAYLLPDNIDNKTSPTRKSSQRKVVPTTAAIANSSSQVDRDREDVYYYDTESDWIEIKAKPVGYVMHPLEQILQWLDRAMLWLEELIVQVWRSIRG